MPQDATSTTVDIPFAPVNAVPTPQVASTEDILAQGRGIALSGVPLQVGGLLEATNQLRARSTGSTASIFPAILGQLGDLRKQYATASQALARKLGPAAGGFTKRGQKQLLGQAGQQYASLLDKSQQEAFAGLLNTQAGFQPTLGSAARAPVVSTSPGAPIDPRIVGASADALGQVLQRYFGS